MEGHAAHDPGAHDPHAGHQAGGHDAHAGHGAHGEGFRRRFWLSLALSVPVVISSHMIQEWFGYHLGGVGWVGPVLGSVVFVYGGMPFLTGAVTEWRARTPGMMLLIAMAISVAFGASLATTAGLLSLDFWWELALLIDIMLLGHWLEMRAIGQARGALSALADLLPDEAEVVRGEDVATVPVSRLSVGDVVLVRPGGRVPADGVVAQGRASVDESMITGESRPVTRGAGDRVGAGTVATDSAIRVRVDATGEETALAGIQRLVAEAEQSRSRAQVLADRAAALLFFVALGSGVITFSVWSLLGQVDTAVVRTVTVLVIACPHALGLAIPLVTAIATSRSAKHGILVKDRLALERMRTVDAVLFDKTGTLTKGAHTVTGVAADDGDESRLLSFAAAVESESEHPLARAIVGAAGARDAARLPAEGFRSIPGMGVEARVDGRAIAVGGPNLLRDRRVTVPERLQPHVRRWESRGAAVLHVVDGERVLGVLALEDEIREESRAAVRDLQALGVRTVLITGDARQVAEAVAADLGIDEVFAEVLPQDKEKAVRELQERGSSVAMVGDGVNDAPALARADVGIAIGAGTDVAIESAGVVLASSDPRAVVSVLRLSRAGYRKMRQNLWWAAGYNIAAIPLAAGALAWAGVDVAPALGAVLMSASTIVVAVNAQLLRRVQL